MHLAILFAGIGILIVIAYGDVRLRRIPNALCLAIAALGLVRIILDRDIAAAGYTAAAAVLTFAATFLVFCRGAIGGGDAKLIAAMALLVGHHRLLNFLFLMSVCGGLLAVTMLAREKLGQKPRHSWWSVESASAKNVSSFPAPDGSSVPYGVAIAAAGAITLMVTR